MVHALELAFQLPLGSRTYCAIDPAYSWTNQEYLLADIDWVLRTLCWSLAGGKKSGQDKPERIGPELLRGRASVQKKSMDKEAYLGLLSTSRKQRNAGVYNEGCDR